LICRFLFRRHNEDGSYTYGYEGSDGSFKIETKTRTGEVSGKYGYVDDLGKLRVVEYGANKYGFQPAGDGITVPAPTLVELRQENDGEPVEEEEEERTKKPSPASRPGKHAFVQQQPRPEPQPQLQREPQRPTTDTVRSSVADFDDYDAAGWTSAQSAEPQRSVAPKPAARPRPVAGRFGGAAAVAARPKSPVLPPPQVAGSFRAAPETGSPQQAPSGSYRSVQAFGGEAWAASRSDAERPTAAVDHSYDTFEDQQEPETESPAVFRAAAKPAVRNGGGSARAAQSPSAANGYRSAPRQMRTSSILDQLAEQYALPESGSPVAHSVSFGLDH
jgi:hypothetical protein